MSITLAERFQNFASINPAEENNLSEEEIIDVLKEYYERINFRHTYDGFEVMVFSDLSAVIVKDMEGYSVQNILGFVDFEAAGRKIIEEATNNSK